jgi:hypothetical protein
MKSMDYFEILKQAAHIIWERKFLWFFGLLIFLGTLASNINVDSNSLFENILKSQYFSGIVAGRDSIVSILSLFFIVIVLILLILRIMANIAIIKAVSNIELYQQLSITAILKETRYYFWRTILLEMIITFFLVVIVIIIATPVLYLFSLKNILLASISMIFAFGIVLPLIVLGFYLIRYASMAIVLLDGTIKTSLELAYAVFLKNMRESLIMGLIMLGVSLSLVFFSIAFLLLLVIVFVPMGFLAFWLFAKSGALIIAIIAGCIFALLMVGMMSLYYAFFNIVWLLFFRIISMEKSKEELPTENVELEVLDAENV